VRGFRSCCDAVNVNEGGGRGQDGSVGRVVVGLWRLLGESDESSRNR
jgi:hypothetical protein